MDGVSRTLAYGHREDGLRTRITHPDGMAFTYGHDAAGRASGLYYGLDTNIPLALWSYDARGLPLSRLEGGGASVAYGHDEIGRLASQADTFVGGTGNVTATFAYNPADQAVRRSRDNDAYAAAPPAAARSYAVNRLNQYTAVGGVAHGYDLNGNLTSDGTRTYTYDIENRLVGSGSVGLRYDPLGRLYEVTGGAAGTRRFLWDGDALVSEHDAAGALAARYVHGSAAGADDPLIWYDGLAVRWLHANHQGSIAAVTNGNGTLHAINAYDEWGVPNAGNVGRFGYTGQIWLPELGLYHYKGRMYAPGLGRFLQTDPVGYEDQLNLYAYVGNDPVNRMDPTGSCGTRIQGAISASCSGDTILGLTGDWRTKDPRNLNRIEPNRPAGRNLGGVRNPLDVARRIAEEELERTRRISPTGGGHNDIYDAERHARWTYRMAQEIGPILAQQIGIGHELEGLAEGQPLREMKMDLHNNAIGLREFTAGRSIPNINTRDLQYLEYPRTYVTPNPSGGYGYD